MAQTTGAALIVVYARLPSHLTWVAFASVGACSMADLSGSTELLVEAECIATLTSSHLNWQLEVQDGEPAAALMAVAKKYNSDTIVVSGRRHRAFGVLAHGAIATKLLHRWTGTLVVLHPPPQIDSGSSIDLQAHN
jgi:nucleotide-binding universal stress UspA family protein